MLKKKRNRNMYLQINMYLLEIYLHVIFWITIKVKKNNTLTQNRDIHKSKT